MKETGNHKKSIYINKTIKYKTFKLWFYTYRRIVIIVSIIGAIALSVGLGVGLGFFKVHKGPEQISGIKTKPIWTNPNNPKEAIQNSFRDKSIFKNYDEKEYTFSVTPQLDTSTDLTENNGPTVTINIPESAPFADLYTSFSNSFKRYGYIPLPSSTSIKHIKIDPITPGSISEAFNTYINGKKFQYSNFSDYVVNSHSDIGAAKAADPSNNLINHIFDSLGENPTSNFLQDGDVFTLGSSACSSCRDIFDIDSKSWDHVDSNPILFNYWSNKGPLSNYASYNNFSQFGKVFNKTWKKEKDTVDENDLPAIPNWKNVISSGSVKTNELKGIQDRVNNHTSFVSGYNEPGYKADDKKGAPGGQNNITYLYSQFMSQIINRYKNNKTSNSNHGAKKSWLTSQYATKLTDGSGSSYSTQNSMSSDDKTPEWKKVKNSFNVDTEAIPGSFDPSSIQIPLICAVHKVPVFYYNDSTNDKIVDSGKMATKLFFYNGRLNNDKLNHFLQYVYSINSAPENASNYDGSFWINNSQNISNTTSNDFLALKLHDYVKTYFSTYSEHKNADDTSSTKWSFTLSKSDSTAETIPIYINKYSHFSPYSFSSDPDPRDVAIFDEAFREAGLIHQ